jgi:transcriptional regulator with XRE-family HTH domain
MHIPAMTLQEWMDAKRLKDAGLAALTDGKVSRSQVSRIRRGVCLPERATAVELERVTGIPWFRFLVGDAATGRATEPVTAAAS